MEEGHSESWWGGAYQEGIGITSKFHLTQGKYKLMYLVKINIYIYIKPRHCNIKIAAGSLGSYCFNAILFCSNTNLQEGEPHVSMRSSQWI
jgi:hypothetical protein